MNHLFSSVLFSLLGLHLASCSILFWSCQKFDIHPLERFNDESYLLLLKRMNYPNVMAYSYPNSNIPASFEEFLRGSFSAYTTNNDYLMDITTKELSGNEMNDFSQIKQDLEESKRSDKNTLFMIISPTTRMKKREIEDGEQEENTSPQKKGPVVYIGQSKSKTYGLIYSSSPLLLVINKTENIYLADASPDLILVDTLKDSTIRLSVTIPQHDDANRKITLRFRFLKVNGYWYLTSVKVGDTLYNIAFNLTIDKEVYAPVGFSYHCSGSTVFSDTSNDVYLYLQNMQVQIEARRENFDEAYDCISFTTVPIWSGILVSGLLIAVSMLSLIALGDIRTMDKFDNHKTKQLTITFNE